MTISLPGLESIPPAAPREPMIYIYCLIASISFQPQKSLSEEGRQPGSCASEGSLECSGGCAALSNKGPRAAPVGALGLRVYPAGTRLCLQPHTAPATSVSCPACSPDQTREDAIRVSLKRPVLFPLVGHSYDTQNEERRSGRASLQTHLGGRHGFGLCLLEGPISTCPYRPSLAGSRPARRGKETLPCAVMAGQNQESNVPASHRGLLVQGQS